MTRRAAEQPPADADPVRRLVLTGLAVAFAFRCGLFNIGGQGQYIVGTVTAVWIGSLVSTLLPAFLHIVVGVVAAATRGRDLGGYRRPPEGDRRRPRGDHDDHAQLDRHLGRELPLRPRRAAPGHRLGTRWVPSRAGDLRGGQAARSSGAPQSSRPCTRDSSLPSRRSSSTRSSSTARPWGTRCARSASTPRPRPTAASASRGTTSWRWRSPVCSPALAGAMDILGWQFRLDLTSVQASTIGFLGIAVALLGRNTAVGIFFAALLFAALEDGTATRNLDPDVFPAELAGNLTEIIQGLVVLFVGAELLILAVWQSARKRSERRGVERTAMSVGAEALRPLRRRRDRHRKRRRHRRHRARRVRALARAPAARPAHGRRCRSSSARCRRRSGSERSRAASGASAGARSPPAALGIVGACLAPGRASQPRGRHHVVDAHLAALVFATPLMFAALGGLVLRAQRGREHRPRGDDADGRVLRRLGRRRNRIVVRRAADRDGRRRRYWGSSTRSSRSTCAPTRSSSGMAINFLASASRGTFVKIYGIEGTPSRPADDPAVNSASSTHSSRVARRLPVQDVVRRLSLMIWIARSCSSSSSASSSSRRRSACESAHAASTRARRTRSGINVYRIRYAR